MATNVLLSKEINGSPPSKSIVWFDLGQFSPYNRYKHLETTITDNSQFIFVARLVYYYIKCVCWKPNEAEVVCLLREVKILTQTHRHTSLAPHTPLGYRVNSWFDSIWATWTGNLVSDMRGDDSNTLSIFFLLKHIVQRTSSNGFLYWRRTCCEQWGRIIYSNVL